MSVIARATIVTPDGVFDPGQVVSLSAEEEIRLIKNNFAEAIESPRELALDPQAVAAPVELPRDIATDAKPEAEFDLGGLPAHPIEAETVEEADEQPVEEPVANPPGRPSGRKSSK